MVEHIIPDHPGLHLQLPLVQTPLYPEQSKSDSHMKGGGGGSGGGRGAGWRLQTGWGPDAAGKSFRHPLSILACATGAHSESVWP